MDETVASRLKLFIDTSGLTSTQFADMCGIPRPSLSQILSGRNKKISDILVGQIHRAFPDLSVVWLLFGEGPVKIGYSRNFTDNKSLKENLGVYPSEDIFGSPRKDNPDSINFGTDNSNIGDDTTKLASMNQTNRSGGKMQNENSNLTSLKSYDNSVNSADNQVFESDLKILDLTRQIEQMRQNPRKVLQITIYYDDSTFETFIPK